MKTRQEMNEIEERAKSLGKETDDALLISLRTELNLIYSYCRSAYGETGDERSHHVNEANRSLERVIELSRQASIKQRDLDDINDACLNVLKLSDRDR